MPQQGQVLELKTTGSDGGSLWAYRDRTDGRRDVCSRRIRKREGSTEALARALERLRREQGLVEAPTLSELVALYLAQHSGEPETVAKLRWLLTKAERVLGHRRINQLRPAEIATWRMSIASGHRFEATQALRQVLGRAVSWGLIDMNPAKQGIDNPQRRHTEKRPFESCAELEVLGPPSSDRFMGRLCSSRPRLACGLESGSRSSGAMSIATHASRTSAAHIEAAESSAPRRKRACAPCRCRRSRSPHSSGCRRTGSLRWCFRHRTAATSSCLRR
jgi:hypothetical protein